MPLPCSFVCVAGATLPGFSARVQVVPLHVPPAAVQVESQLVEPPDEEPPLLCPAKPPELAASSPPPKVADASSPPPPPPGSSGKDDLALPQAAIPAARQKTPAATPDQEFDATAKL